MILRLNDSGMSIIAEDSMDAAYLKSIFNGEIKIIKDTVTIRNGFHTTNEEEVAITFQKVNE